jgi:putative thioredoxin
VRGVIDQVLAAAEQNGVTGRAPVDGDQVPADPQVPPEPPLPPLHQEAYDAIEAGDYPAAIAAYDKALRQDPKDAMATAGLAQAQLLARTADLDDDAVRAAADAAPSDAGKAMIAADLDLVIGNVQAAFDRLLGLLAGLDADDKEAVRKRLIEYFEVIGPTDPAVIKARQRLASALY